MGICLVVVYFEVDCYVLYVKCVDEVYSIGVDLLVGYFNLCVLVNLVVESGCDVLYFGYGFFLENVELVEICVECGIKFIGLLV